jgi:ketosteroid isomerase-like protein
MKNKIINKVFTGCIMTLLIACNSNEKKTEELPAIDKEQIKKEIQARENEFAEVYNSRELKNIGYYAEDAKVFSENKEPLIGKEAIIGYLKTGLDSSSKGNIISFVTNEVFVTDAGNQVVEIGYYKLVDSTKTPINTGNYMVLFEKRDGKYVSVREMSTSDMPVE